MLSKKVFFTFLYQNIFEIHTKIADDFSADMDQGEIDLEIRNNKEDT